MRSQSRNAVRIVVCDDASVVGGQVVASVLPGGRVASTTHRGSYAGLGGAHDAVVRWIQENGERAAGARWEVYGPHHDDPAEVWTKVCYLLA